MNKTIPKALVSQTDKFVGRHTRYPDLTGKRQAEGGKRLQGEIPEGREGTPLVTIITVCWNSAKTIEQAFQSVRNQTYTNIEYVVVDGGSSDGTVDLLKAHEDLIDYYVSEPDNGLYFAMNKGLELARGDYILFLNSDDWYELETVEKLVQAHQDSGSDFVSALANYVDGNGHFIRVQAPSPFDAGVDFRMPLRHETMLVPAWLYDEFGPYDTSYRVIADRVYTAGLFWKGYSHSLLSEPLLNFSMEGVSSVNLDQLYEERERALRDRYPSMSVMAMRDLTDLERVSPERLCEISRNFRNPEFRAAATAYALDREAQGHKAWQDIDLNAFSPTLKPRSVNNQASAAERRATDRRPIPTVSVILPIYNAQETLSDCLDSLLAQTLSDIEIICIDDASPDGSAAVLADYARRDNRIRIRRNEINVGLGSTRNRGIALARGTYIFHIDPDDVIPPDALKSLVEQADKDGADMVRGAFMHEQLLLGQASKAVRKGIDPSESPIVNTSLAAHPDLLKSTEGHWSYIYRTSFAKRVFYPEDLKMGQDSIFLVQALCRARKVSVIADVVYKYRANPNSAMNVFNFRKYLDEIEWRYRAWTELVDKGHRSLGEHLLCNYWNMRFFETLDSRFDATQKCDFFRRLAYTFQAAGNGDLSKTRNSALSSYFKERLNHFAKIPARPKKSGPNTDTLRIAVLSSSDHGGAGLACLRSVEALRARGHEVTLYTVFPRKNAPYIWRVPIKSAHHAMGMEEETLRSSWRRMGVLNRQEEPALSARELFSKTGSVVDPTALGAVIANADIVHLHWVVGMLDYDRIAELLRDKPVVWTLHDMNSITGGCHYSEGCTGYEKECDNCPLLTGPSDLPHKAWKKKQQAFAKIKSLDVICPSEWLAGCVRQSSLLGNRQVHVIPNLFPSDDFEPINKIVARRTLGLPLNKKLIVFGADSLDNRRKGGDILRASLKHLRVMPRMADVEVVFFGGSQLDLDMPVHSMGYVNDPHRLSLIYAAADVFAFPSREDNAPQTLIEAMMSGTTAVAFPVGNVIELIKHKDTGYIARYEDAEDFAKGLVWALAAPRSQEALARGLRSHLVARTHNDPATAVARHLRLYQEILESTQQPPGA